MITAVAALGTMDAGMWRMNGTPALGMSFLYHNFYLCPSLKRHDLIMLQVKKKHLCKKIAAALFNLCTYSIFFLYTFRSLYLTILVFPQSAICSIEDPGRITFALLERFQLEDWADKKLEKPWRKGNKDEV